MTKHSSAPTPTDIESGRTIRLGELAGDRLCSKCCFNLNTQTIVREPHYGLAIVRCPECGTPASLQEYPVLGSWANRIGFVLAGFWMLFILAWFVGCSALVFAGVMTVSEELAEPYRTAAYAAALKNETDKAPMGPPVAAVNYWNTPFDQAWWDALPPEKFFQDSGGWRKAIDWRQLWFWTLVTAIGLPLAISWPVFLPHLRRRWLLLVYFGMMILATAFLGIANLEQRSWGPYAVRAVAMRQVGLPLYLLNFAFIGVLMSVAMLCGRAIARGLVVLFLPPRLRAPFSFLWICDGKRLPRPSVPG